MGSDVVQELSDGLSPGLVQCLCKDRDPFVILLEKTLGMVICGPLVFQVASVSASPVEYCNCGGVGC